MKTIFTLFYLLIIIGVQSQDLVEKFRSEPGSFHQELSFIREWKNDDYLIKDFNNNGSPDIISSVIYRDSLFVSIYDGRTKTELYHQFLGVVNAQDYTVWRMADFRGDGHVWLVGSFSDVSGLGHEIVLVEPQQNKTIFIPGRVYAITDIDGDGVADLIYADVWERSVVALGLENEGSGIQDREQQITRSALDIDLKYESGIRGVHLNYNNSFFRDTGWNIKNLCN